MCMQSRIHGTEHQLQWLMPTKFFLFSYTTDEHQQLDTLNFHHSLHNFSYLIIYVNKLTQLRKVVKSMQAIQSVQLLTVICSIREWKNVVGILLRR